MTGYDDDASGRSCIGRRGVSRRGLLAGLGAVAVGNGMVGTALAERAGTRQSEWTNAATLSAADATGERALVGAPGASDGGAAYVFAFDGTCWHVQQKLVVSEFDAEALLGTSVALSTDGTVGLLGGTRRGAGEPRCRRGLPGRGRRLDRDGAVGAERPLAA